MSQAKLYQYDVCPFCWKVRVGLGMKNADFERVEVHPLNKKEISFSSEWKKVPIWISNDGKQVNDSTDILKHLDAEYTETQIFKGDEKEKKWLDWSETYVKSIPPLIYRNMGDAIRAFDYITRVGNFSFMQRQLVKYSGAAVMKMVAKKRKKQYNITDPQAHLEKMMQEWEGSLEGDFNGGQTPNAADVAVYGFTMSLKDLPAEKLIGKHPKFQAWCHKMGEKSGLTLNS